jgi:hypothetical protein
MRRLALGVILVVAFSSCASNAVRIIPNDELPRAIYPQGRNNANVEPTTKVVTLYMVDGNRLIPVERSGRVRKGISGPTLVTRALLSGPTQEELTDKGYTTALPSEIELIAVTRKGTLAEVDLSREFLRIEDTDQSEQYLLRVAQIVFTLTELEKIDSVKFLVEGQAQSVPDQDGNLVNSPVARGRYNRFEPLNPFGSAASDGPLRIDVRGPEEEADPAEVP